MIYGQKVFQTKTYWLFIPTVWNLCKQSYDCKEECFHIRSHGEAGKQIYRHTKEINVNNRLQCLKVV